MSSCVAPQQGASQEAGGRLTLRQRRLRGARLSDALLAASIVLALASQFRLGGLPLGPGEACLFGWFGVRLAGNVLGGGDLALGPAAWVAGKFWLAFGAALSLGLLRALIDHDLISWPDVVHDVVAYAVAACLCILCLSGRDVGFRLSRVTRDMMALGAVALLIQIVSAGDLIGLPGIDPWFYDRFRGWADNPNQLSLFCALLVAIAGIAAEESRTRPERFMALACAAAALTAGLMTKGNTLRLSLILGLGCYAVVAAGLIFTDKARRRTMPGLMVSFTLLVLPLAALSLVPFAAAFRTEDIAEQISRDKEETLSEANLRFDLWSGAWERGLHSSFLGLGPGPHVPVPVAVVIRQKWEPDPSDTTLGDVVRHGATMESHNTYLELFSQGGLLVVGAFAWLMIRAARQALRVRSAARMALLCVVLTFGMFHVILRHPIVWFGLCLCLGGSRGSPAAAVPRAAILRDPSSSEWT